MLRSRLTSTEASPRAPAKKRSSCAKRSILPPPPTRSSHGSVWLQKHPKATGKVATIGWCYGGGWSLNASIATPVDATIVYYGRVDQPADRLARLKGPVLGHFATRDQWINRPMVEGFERAMAEAGKPLTIY
jgi:dienelactone hydrolase